MVKNKGMTKKGGRPLKGTAPLSERVIVRFTAAEMTSLAEAFPGSPKAEAVRRTVVDMLSRRADLL